MLYLLSAVLSLCFVDVNLFQMAPKHAPMRRAATMRRDFTTLPYLVQQERWRHSMLQTATFNKNTTDPLVYDYKDKWWSTLRTTTDNVIKETTSSTQHINAPNVTTESVKYTMTDVHNGDEHYTAIIIKVGNSSIIAKIKGTIPTGPFTDVHDEVETSTSGHTNITEVGNVTDATVAAAPFEDTEPEINRYTTEKTTKKGFNKIYVRNLPSFIRVRPTASTTFKTGSSKNKLRYRVITDPKNYKRRNTEQYKAFDKIKSLIDKLKKVVHLHDYFYSDAEKGNCTVTSIYENLNRIFKSLKDGKHLSYDTLKFFQSLMNKTDLAAENVDRLEMNDMVDDYNRSLNIIKNWRDFNVSKIFDCNNITYVRQLGIKEEEEEEDTIPSNQEKTTTRHYEYYPDSPPVGTTRTTWSLLHYHDKQHHKPPYQFSTMPMPYLTRFPPSAHTDFIQKLRETMAIYHEGYFVTFLASLLAIVADMPDHHLRLLCISMNREYDRLTKEETYLFSFGESFLILLHDFAIRVGETPTDFTKYQAELLSEAVRKRQYAIAPEIAGIINYIDKLYEDDEGYDLFKALELVDKYPNITRNPHVVLRNLSSAIFAPYRRLSGTYKRQVLIDSINREINRVNLQPVPRAIEDDIMNKRLGWLVNKTRFAVVKREKSKFVKSKKVRTNTAKYNTDTTNSVRYKVVTRPTLRLKLTKTNKTFLQHFKLKHPKMFSKYMKLKRLVQDSKKTIQTPSYDINENTKPDISIGRTLKNTHKRFLIEKGVTPSDNTNSNTKRDIYIGTTPRNTQKRFKVKKGVTKKTELNQINNDRKPDSDSSDLLEESAPNPKFSSKSSECDSSATLSLEVDLTTHPEAASKPNLSPYTAKILIVTNKTIKVRQPVVTKQTTKVHIPIVIKKTTKVHKVKVENKPKYINGNADYKTYKYGDGLKQKPYSQTTINEVLNKLTARSSYSDEEESLKFYLFDALRHNDTYALKNARRFYQGHEPKRRINDLSSYSSDEVILKTNIYKGLGFNHNYRRTNIRDIMKRVNDNYATNSTAKDAKIIPVNESSSYSDEKYY